MQDPQKKLRALRRLIAHPATPDAERAAARSAIDRLTAAASADVAVPDPASQDPQATPAPDPPEIANEWNPGPWIGEKTLDNAWAGD